MVVLQALQTPREREWSENLDPCHALLVLPSCSATAVTTRFAWVVAYRRAIFVIPRGIPKTKNG